jgi:hypothetical protein
MRALCLGLTLLLVGGCASNEPLPHRTLPKVILGAVVVGAAGLAVGAAVKSRSIENSLANDYKARDISGSEFADRDSQGQRWNRIGRASAFVSGVALLGLGVLWEMSLSDHAQVEPTPIDKAPIFPAPTALTVPLPRATAAAAP